MSGRAGRRGLDDKGIVILTVDQKMTPGNAKNIVKVWFQSIFQTQTQYCVILKVVSFMSIFCYIGSARSAQQRVPSDVQHGSELASS